ncbi:hypothetical protein T11_12969 [Trichinella zimbabwensis]|uniref:Uncharacterized protein n=1 Tax=Trichinella zimbabwensis TaxID=268475 RepID=A0A0V1GG28_9BILA|nr:hypothetical protein T11_12969 [Trichinella zimbabwensis]
MCSFLCYQWNYISGGLRFLHNAIHILPVVLEQDNGHTLLFGKSIQELQLECLVNAVVDLL